MGELIGLLISRFRHAVKELALKQLELPILPTRQSQEKFEQCLLQQGSKGITMGEINKSNTKTDATVTTFEFPIGDIRGKAPMKNIHLSFYHLFKE